MRFFYERGGKCELLSAKGLTSAAFWLGTLDVFYYAPMLFALAVFTGFATGFLTQEILRRLLLRNKKISQKL